MPSIESVTLGAASLALDAAALRHQAIASNIANSNTPGYQPLRVSFEEQLGALRSALLDPATHDMDALATVEPRIEREPAPAASATGADATSRVALDDEIAKLSANAVHYQALLRAVGRQLSLLALAASDGKR